MSGYRKPTPPGFGLPVSFLRRPLLKQVMPSFDRMLEKVVPGSRLPLPCQFPPGQGPERNISGPARQALGDPLHQEEVCGASQDKTAGSPWDVFVHGPLDGQEEIRFPLYFVQDQLWGPPNQIFRSVSGLASETKIIQGQIGPILKEGMGPDQGALPGLPSPHEHHNREDPQRPGKELACETRKYHESLGQ
jgi:hypothetical protein